MKEIYLEVEPAADGGIIITDWSDWFQYHLENNNYREMSIVGTFFRVKGKTCAYNIKGLNNDYAQCKAFAIWYHVAKANGKIGRYRLD